MKGYYATLLLFSLGCAGGVSSDDTGADTNADTETDTETDVETDTDIDLNPDDYNGRVPDVAKGMPTFSAINYDGSARGPADLQGQRTVMWFFPFAGTFG